MHSKFGHSLGIIDWRSSNWQRVRFSFPWKRLNFHVLGASHTYVWTVGWRRSEDRKQLNGFPSHCRSVMRWIEVCTNFRPLNSDVWRTCAQDDGKDSDDDFFTNTVSKGKGKQKWTADSRNPKVMLISLKAVGYRGPVPLLNPYDSFRVPLG
jgi:hypothetical protein